MLVAAWVLGAGPARRPAFPEPSVASEDRRQGAPTVPAGHFPRTRSCAGSRGGGQTCPRRGIVLPLNDRKKSMEKNVEADVVWRDFSGG